jgi:methylglutaconyl-CoA hydratase
MASIQALEYAQPLHRGLAMIPNSTPEATPDIDTENPIAEPFVLNPAPDAAGPVRIEASLSGVVTLTLDRPAFGNRFTSALAGALREAVETLHGADHVRLVLLRGAGDDFCAGRDPEWLADSGVWTESDLREDAMSLGQALRGLRDLPALTVALVQGQAFGPGMGLVAACDMAIAAEGASFGFPEIKLGLLPAIPAPFVVEAIGARQAGVLMSTGRSVDAHAAFALGLVQAVVPDVAGLDAAAARLADELGAAAPIASVEAKRLAAWLYGQPIDHALIEDLARRFAVRRRSPEAVAGVQAALDGRAPIWND